MLEMKYIFDRKVFLAEATYQHPWDRKISRYSTKILLTKNVCEKNCDLEIFIVEKNLTTLRKTVELSFF